jgi:hypothetical protein
MQPVFLNSWAKSAVAVFLLGVLVSFVIRPGAPLDLYRTAFWNLPLLYVVAVVLAIIALNSKTPMRMSGKIICIALIILGMMPVLGLIAFFSTLVLMM